jgi:hypothetical protein
MYIYRNGLCSQPKKARESLQYQSNGETGGQDQSKVSLGLSNNYAIMPVPCNYIVLNFIVLKNIIESTVVIGLGLGGFIEVAMICFLNIVGGSRASTLAEKTDNKIRAAGRRVHKLSLDFQP